MSRRPGPAARTLSAVAAVLWLAGGCGRTPVSEGPPEPGDTVAATVAGETLWASDVQRAAVADGLIGEGEPFGPTARGYAQVLDSEVDRMLLAREAEARDIDDDPIVRRRLEAARDAVLGDALLEREVAAAVTEDAVTRLYGEFSRASRSTETVRARQIVLATEAEAQAVRRALTSGAAFDTVAMERSTDASTRFNGGDLGFVDLSVLPAALARTLRAAPPGQLVGPVAVDGGFAIMRVEERRNEPVPSLEEMRPQITRFLSFDQTRKLLQRLRSEAQVERTTDSPASPPPASAPQEGRP